MQILEGELERELLRLTVLRAPFEAVGLILSKGRVVELPNHSETPENRFKVSRADILAALGNETDLAEVVFWHSHPGGGIGPSRIDMQEKTLFLSHLVVTLEDTTLIPSWY